MAEVHHFGTGRAVPEAGQDVSLLESVNRQGAIISSNLRSPYIRLRHHHPKARVDVGPPRHLGVLASSRHKYMKAGADVRSSTCRRRRIGLPRRDVHRRFSPGGCGQAMTFEYMHRETSRALRGQCDSCMNCRVVRLHPLCLPACKSFNMACLPRINR